MERLFLSIRETADALGVDYKTIYRLVREGELPAGKIGGVYRIRREDIDALFERHRLRAAVPEGDVGLEEPVKCGRCWRILPDPDAIGGECAHDSCEAVLCRECWDAQPDHCCATHRPSPAERLAAARADLDAGRISLLVTAVEARRRETAFLARFEDKVRALTAVRHPLSGQTHRVRSRDVHRSESDESETLADLLHVGYLETEVRSRLPLNAGLRFALGEPPALVLEARVVSNLAAHAGDGFDTQPLRLEDAMARLDDAVTRAEATGVVTVLGLAATTGWTAAATDYVSDGTRGDTFHHRLMLSCLIDLVDGRLAYNRLDARIQLFLDLFTPLLPDEEAVRVAGYIEQALVVRDSLSLDEVMQAAAASRDNVRRAFERLTATRRFVVYALAGEGDVISRAEG
jgi:excisionase family DNA binding protein